MNSFFLKSVRNARIDFNQNSFSGNILRFTFADFSQDKLRAPEVHNCIENDDPEIKAEATAKLLWRKNDSIAKAMISEKLSDEKIEYIKDCESAKDMLNVLEKSHGLSALNHKLSGSGNS